MAARDHDDERQHQDEEADAEDLHPQGCAGRGSKVGTHRHAVGGVAIVVRKGGRVRHACVSGVQVRTHGRSLSIHGVYVNPHRIDMDHRVYYLLVPKLWKETIEAHRREVGDAILDTTAALVAEHGLRSVTMSQIAEETGIGRATLYKYFTNV